MDGNAVLIVDNGGATIKVGWSDTEDTDRVVSNGIYRSQRDKRTYIADELDTECTDFGGLRNHLPCERGILTNWDVQKVVWDRVFKDVLTTEPEETSLLLTEPVFNMPNVQQNYDQIIFEEYDFASYLRCPPPALVAEKGRCGIIVDSGFSFTHVVPVLFGEVQWYGVRRIDIGGKSLTNWMKELISFRHWFMMDQTHLINHIKEETCFLSTNLVRDLEISKFSNTGANVCRYLLPDFNDPTNKFGSALDLSDERTIKDFRNEQVLYLNNERFTVPEALFQPALIGLQQAGLAQTIANSISVMPLEMQGLFWDSILCIGGNARFQHFHERLFNELRTLAPSDFDVQVIVPDDPINHTLRSARNLLSMSDATGPDGIRSRFVTRAEYAEHGSNLTRARFGGPTYGPNWSMSRGLGDLSDVESAKSSSSDVNSRVNGEGEEGAPALGADGLPVKPATKKVKKDDKKRKDSKMSKKQRAKGEHHSWKSGGGGSSKKR